MQLICPSRSSISGVGCFFGHLHRVWETRHTQPSIKLTLTAQQRTFLCRDKNLINSCIPIASHAVRTRTFCSVQPTLEGKHWRLLTTAPSAQQNSTPSLFLKVLQLWGNTWLWEYMSVYGGVARLDLAISTGTLVAVTDGSYVRELYPNLCSAAFVLECSKGCGRVVGSFLEALLVANAYRKELLGLMAIHLILLSIIKIHKILLGSMR
jgi:hypothetical protein